MTTINAHTTRAAGTILTATIYNTDHVNHVLNASNLNAGKIEKAASPVVDGDLIAFSGTGGAAAKTSGVNMSRVTEVANGRTVIASGTIGAVASVQITDIPQNFTYLSMQITGASNVNAANTLRVRGSDDNGVSFAVATYLGLRYAAGAAIAASTLGIHDGGVNTLAADTQTAAIQIFNYQQGSRQISISHALIAGVVSCSHMRISGIGALNALAISWTAAGNFDAGSYSLEGFG